MMRFFGVAGAKAAAGLSIARVGPAAISSKGKIMPSLKPSRVIGVVAIIPICRATRSSCAETIPSASISFAIFLNTFG